MSIHWWAQRLDSVYLLHEGRYRMVRMVNVDDERKAELQGQDVIYPEQYEDALKVAFMDNDEYRWVRWRDCDVVWPKERYCLIDGKATWWGRSMERVFVLGPTERMYSQGRANHATFEQWLASRNPEWATLDDMLLWEDTDMLLDDVTAVIRGRGNTVRRIYHCNQWVASISRKGNTTTVTKQCPLPEYLSLFLNKVMGDTVYCGPAFEKEEVVDNHLHYNWEDRTGKVIDGPYQYMIQDSALRGEHIVARGNAITGGHSLYSYDHLVYYFRTDVHVWSDLQKIAIEHDLQGNYRLGAEDDDEDEDDEEDW